MGLYEFAEAELNARVNAIQDPEAKQMEQAVADGILAVVKAFSEQGHSGFSAGYAIGLLEKLLRYEPLSPLTGADEEWQEISAEIMGRRCWQNKRCSRVFKEEDGSVYDVQGILFEDPDGSRYTSANSSVPVTFPYTPTTTISKMPAVATND